MALTLFPLVCHKCKQAIEIGVRARFDLKNMKATCIPCYDKERGIPTAEELDKLWDRNLK